MTGIASQVAAQDELPALRAVHRAAGAAARHPLGAAVRLGRRTMPGSPRSTSRPSCRPAGCSAPSGRSSTSCSACRWPCCSMRAAPAGAAARSPCSCCCCSRTSPGRSFFALHQVGTAFLLLAAMIVMTGALIVLLWRIRRGAALLMLVFLRLALLRGFARLFNRFAQSERRRACTGAGQHRYRSLIEPEEPARCSPRTVCSTISSR